MRNLWRGHTDAYCLGILACLGERCVTEAATFDVLKQEGATVLAYLYHWSVLRCGIPVTEHRYGSTQPARRTACPRPNAANVAYQATHKHRSRSEWVGNGRSRASVGPFQPGEQRPIAGESGNTAACLLSRRRHAWL